jgi:pimeloyl-ACP methyl ester carboxylesterase
VPVLVMHGDDDQIVPYADSGPLSAKLVQNGTLKTYHGFPHGMPTTQAETINADLLASPRPLPSWIWRSASAMSGCPKPSCVSCPTKR